MRAAGPVSVTVVNPSGLEDTLFGGFLYIDGLLLSAVAPASGSLEGGDVVEIIGGGFARGVIASEPEIESNPRARSARLRVLERTHA